MKFGFAYRLMREFGNGRLLSVIKGVALKYRMRVYIDPPWRRAKARTLRQQVKAGLRPCPRCEGRGWIGRHWTCYVCNGNTWVSEATVIASKSWQLRIYEPQFVGMTRKTLEVSGDD